MVKEGTETRSRTGMMKVVYFVVFWQNKSVDFTLRIKRTAGCLILQKRSNAITACSSIFIQLISLLDNKLWINVELLCLTCWTADTGLQTDFYLQELVNATSDESQRCTAGRGASRRISRFEVSGSNGPIMQRYDTASTSHVRLTITYHTFRINITRFRKLCDFLCDSFISTYINPFSFLLQSLMYQYLKNQACAVYTVFYADQRNKLSTPSARRKLNNWIQNTQFILS
jgi:hypothetical protein